MAIPAAYVRFAPESGHPAAWLARPLSSKKADIGKKILHGQFPLPVGRSLSPQSHPRGRTRRLVRQQWRPTRSTDFADRPCEAMRVDRPPRFQPLGKIALSQMNARRDKPQDGGSGGRSLREDPKNLLHVLRSACTGQAQLAQLVWTATRAILIYVNAIPCRELHA